MQFMSVLVIAHKADLTHQSVYNRHEYKRNKMAEDSVASSAGKVIGKATVKAFMSPSFDIIKVIPQGIIEVVMRAAAVVS